MGIAEKQTKQTIICPRCKGNGYFRVKQDVYTHKDVVVQCPMCKSEGEIDAGYDYDYSGINLFSGLQ